MKLFKKCVKCRINLICGIKNNFGVFRWFLKKYQFELLVVIYMVGVGMFGYI